MDTIGNYVLLKWIGSGTFGKVCQARDKRRDGVIVALKMIPKISRSEKEIETDRTECKIQKNLNHPNIIRMLDSFETEDALIIVTEYAEKGVLSNLLVGRTGGVPVQTVKKIACDLVSALNYLHDRRILHRDLKPQNVLIGSDGHYKLCDFGFARTMGIDTHLLTSIKGTPLYMAPEIMNRFPYDQNAELWSLGCILYELLMGTPPFFTTKLFELVEMVKRHNIHFPDSWPTDCSSFLQGLLKKNPRHRLTWPELRKHPFIRDELRIYHDAGEYSLTKALSPSQEFAKESERQMLLQKFAGLERKLAKTAKKYEEAQKQLQNYGKNSHPVSQIQTASPNSARGVSVPHSKVNPPSGTAGVTTLMKNLKVQDGNQNKPEGGSDDSSCETLTSSSDGESYPDEDDITVIIGPSTSNERRRSGDSDKIGTSNDKNTSPALKPDWDTMCTSGEGLFTLHSFGTDDKPINSGEWITFLNTTMREIIENPECLCEKHFLTVIVAPLRNHLAGAEVIEKIADLLSVPFVLDLEEDMHDKIVAGVKSIYLDSKVLPNLLYSCKLIVRRKKLERESVELEEIAEILTADDVAALRKCLQLVCFLIHLDGEDFVVQFCDSICVLQLFPLLLLCLKLDKRNDLLASNTDTLANDTLAILSHLMRIIPSNSSIVEELILGNTLKRKGHEEFWKLLKHRNTRVKCKAIRILTRLSINSENTRETFLKNNCVKLWKHLKDCVNSEIQELREAATFAFRNIEMLSGAAPIILLDGSPKNSPPSPDLPTQTTLAKTEIECTESR